MKKVILRVVMAIAIVTFAGVNLYQNQQVDELSALMLANIDALSADESDSGDSGESGRSLICYTTFTPADWFHEDDYFINCDTCERDKGRNLRDRSHCYR